MIGRNIKSIINYLVSVISLKLLSRKNLLGLLLCSGVPLLFSTPSVASVTVEQQIAQVVTAGTVNRPTLKVGSQGDAVNELQAALKIMGYYNGAVDGTYGQTTAAAVSQFKQSAGLAPDGVVDAATWQQLFPGGQTVAASSDETSSPATTTNTNFPRPNQQTAANLPKPNQTAANLPKPVVISNQESRTTTTTRISTGNGQEETVRTTSTTRNSNNNTSRQTTRTTNVNSTNNRGRNTTNTASTRTNTNRNNTNNTSTANRGRNTTTNTTSTRNTNNRTARSTTSDSSTYRTRQTDSNLQKPGIQYTAAGFPILRLGMRGEEVYDLQTRLQRLGYLKNKPDGDFGADTEAAIKALQKRFGMQPDGVAGGETWEILTRRRNSSQS